MAIPVAITKTQKSYYFSQVSERSSNLHKITQKVTDRFGKRTLVCWSRTLWLLAIKPGGLLEGLSQIPSLPPDELCHLGQSV